MKAAAEEEIRKGYGAKAGKMLARSIGADYTGLDALPARLDDSDMILLVAPYPTLKETADSLAPRYDIPIRTVVGDLGEGLAAARPYAADGAIVVSRGGTAKLIRESLGIDVIEIGISHFDLLRILRPFVGGSKRVAVVGFRGLTDDAKEICRILEIPAVFLPVDDESEVPARIEALSGMDIDCLMGDMVAIRSAARLGAELHLIESSAAAVAEALDKAAIVARGVMLRRESDLRIRAVFNSVQDGIVSVDRDGLVEIANRKAHELLAYSEVVGSSLESTIPGLDLKRIMAEGKDSLGKVWEVCGRRTVVNVTPIVVQGRPEGAVAVLQEIGTIQDLEKKVRKQLHAKGLFAKHRFSDILAESELMRKCVDVARQYARSTSSIVIFGETGTGKEILAQSIHNESPVRDGPFVAINCGALPPTLLESELFGYVEGAFTGAAKGGKAGLFEMAHGGTIFLDEINALEVQLQNKLLRVLQEREVMRIGDGKVTPVSVRVIAASNVRLREEIAQGRIRKDLFYRLSVLDITIPPLRDRAADIPLLFGQFVEECARTNGDQPPPMPESFQKTLLSYPWPGNVRELQNVAEKYTVLCRLLDREAAAKLVAESMRPELEEAANGKAEALIHSGTLDEIERRAVRAAFDEEGGNLSRTAKRLGIDRQTLRKKLGSPTEGKDGNND